jgi:hypothetical protein
MGFQTDADNHRLSTTANRFKALRLQPKGLRLPINPLL